MSRKIYIIIAVVLAAVLSVSTFFIIRNHIDSVKQNEVYDNLAEIVEDEPPKENEGDACHWMPSFFRLAVTNALI